MSKRRWQAGELEILVLSLLSACGTRPVSASPDRQGAASVVLPKDSTPLAFIPAGKFEMGSDAYRGEEPAHLVIMGSFLMDRTEVTNGEYDECVRQRVCQPPQRFSSYTRPQYFDSPQYANYPVIDVTWGDADSFCRWAGRRLPTEAEWERAARGFDERIYPWGNGLPRPDLLDFDFSVGDTSAVGAYPLGASPYQVLDLAGNVEEWVADWYQSDYYAHSPRSDPYGPAATGARVVRGGSWLDNRNFVRAGLRLFYPPDSAFVNLGFRCADSVEAGLVSYMGAGHQTLR